MLRLRRAQLEQLGQATNVEWTRRQARRLAELPALKGVVSEIHLRMDVAAWTEDARRWGLSSTPTIERYVETMAISQGRRQALEQRIEGFLTIYHPQLVSSVNVQKFLAPLMAFATEHRIFEDEGITWLSVIVLAGVSRGADSGWISEALSISTGNDELRLQQLHDGAVARGWLQR